MTTAPHPRFPSLRLVEHPLVLHKLSRMRDRTTPTVLFRQLLREIALLMGYEILRELPLAHETIETPLSRMEAPVIAGKKVAFVPILRAGLVMAEGLHELVPSARTGHIGLYRDHETKRPVEYLVKLPEPEGRLFILVDPMLATGYSIRHGVEVLNRHGVPDAAIRVLALVVAPEGMAMFAAAHPEIPVFAAALDERLDERAYIVPGLGDAGDRLFGTK
jgi:uracil phosphoribosyltransferase